MTHKFFDLSDRVILVTGAAGHLGAAISARLVDAGAYVYLNGRSPDKVGALAGSLGDKAVALPFDVADEKAVKEAVRRIKDDHDRLDGLVNNAFAALSGSVDEATQSDFQNCFKVNVSALFHLSQQCLPLMERDVTGDSSSIVSIASMYGMVSPDPSIYGGSGMNNPPFYGASKAAVIQLMRYLACHLADKGVRANAISPGPFPPESVIANMPEFHAELQKKTPLNRVGKPEEVAAAVHFLLSPDSGYINGINLPVDGGWTAW